ncbi:MAG: DinB family protein [Flavobacteriaceae bacterium]|nr:MAG: DinB family protein [Flavobacteriaceae bacterium]
MNKKEIITILENKHLELFDWLEKQSIEKWEQAVEGKWTSGQHILHLTNSIKLLNTTLKTPKFVLKRKFGICNRKVRSYEEVAKRYDERLAESRDKAALFNKNLKIPSKKEKDRLIITLQIQNKKLQYKTNKWSDIHLDTLLIPHPLMGRMTVREIIMWTACHTAHHTHILKEKY